jgi:hypothetical protein
MGAKVARPADDHAVFDRYRSAHAVGYDVMCFCPFSEAMISLAALANVKNTTSARRAHMLLPAERSVLDSSRKIQVL